MGWMWLFPPSRFPSPALWNSHRNSEKGGYDALHWGRFPPDSHGQDLPVLRHLAQV